MLAKTRSLRLHRRLSRRFCSNPNPNPNPSPNPNPNPSHSPNPNPNPNQPSQSMRSFVRDLLKEDDPDKLTEAFKRASDSDRFRRQSGVYEVAVLRLAAAGRPDAVETVVDHLKSYATDFATNEGPASRLIYLYGRVGMLDHAAATFHQLPSLPSPRTIFSFNSLINACARAKDTDRIVEFLREIPASDPTIVPNTISYNMLISAFCKKDDVDAAEDTLTIMEKKGIEPDLITFNSLLEGFYRNGRFSDGERIWAKMIEKNIYPDIITYNSKMRALSSKGKIIEAIELIGELRSGGLKPDTFTFNALIHGYCREGKVEEAMQIYRELGKNGCSPNRWTFEQLIPKLRATGQFSLALKLCNESINLRVFMDSAVFQEVVNGLVEIGKLEEAKQLVDRGKQRRHLRKSLRAPMSCLFA